MGEREWGRAAKGWGRGCLCGNMYGAECLDEGSRVGEEKRQLDLTPRPLPPILILWAILVSN